MGCRFKRMCSTIATSAASAAVGSRNCSTPLPRATLPRVPVAVPPPPWCWGRSGGQPLSAVDGTCSDPWWRGGGGAAKAGCRGAGGVVVRWWKRWGGKAVKGWGIPGLESGSRSARAMQAGAGASPPSRGATS